MTRGSMFCVSQSTVGKSARPVYELRSRDVWFWHS